MVWMDKFVGPWVFGLLKRITSSDSCSINWCRITPNSIGTYMHKPATKRPKLLSTNCSSVIPDCRFTAIYPKIHYENHPSLSYQAATSFPETVFFSALCTFSAIKVVPLHPPWLILLHLCEWIISMIIPVPNPPLF